MILSEMSAPILIIVAAFIVFIRHFDAHIKEVNPCFRIRSASSWLLMRDFLNRSLQ